MTIAAPSIGDRIRASFAINVSAMLNRLIPLQTTADQSTDNSTTWVDIAGLSFAVEAGRQYASVGALQLSYVVSATNQGIQVALDCPTGNVLVHVTTYGQGAPNTATESRLASSGDATSISSTDGTTGRKLQVSIVYDCTASGTLKLQFRRGGTSGGSGVTIRKGGGGIVLVSA